MDFFLLLLLIHAPLLLFLFIHPLNSKPKSQEDRSLSLD